MDDQGSQEPQDPGQQRDLSSFMEDVLAESTTRSSTPPSNNASVNSPRVIINNSSFNNSVKNPIHTRNPRTSTLPTNLNKRKGLFQFEDFARPSPFNSQSTITTVEEGVEQARNSLLKAALLAQSDQPKQKALLDLLEILRDYTETGRVQKKEAAIFTSQINRLEGITRSVNKTYQAQASASTSVPTSASIKASTPALRTQYTSSPSQQGLPPTWASKAAQNLPKGKEWTQVISKKKGPAVLSPQKALTLRKLVLIKPQIQQGDTSLTIRNNINNAFARQGVSTPVVASVGKSEAGNLVLTTTLEFNAQYLLDKTDIWKHIAPCQEALLIQPWFKVAIHGIPTSTENLDIVRDEIQTFNRGLQIVGKPFWLSSQNRRKEKTAGSICVSFKSAEDAAQAISNPLYILGLSLKAEKVHFTPSSTQCFHCQGYGHTEARCRKSSACRVCSESHLTAHHKCNQDTCSTKGKACVHSILKCANCKGPHTADNKDCESYLATLSPRNQHSMNPDVPFNVGQQY